MHKKKIAFVNQRYGEEVNGGSELYTRQIAELLSSAYDVEVLTTCALDYTTWENHYPQGESLLNGVTVRRFPVETKRNEALYDAITFELIRKHKVSAHDQGRWIEAMGPNCPALVRYVENHYARYDVFVVVTYLYYLAVKLIPIVGQKAIFIPTAHQEPFIRFPLYKTVFEWAKAFIFLTDEEKELVQGLFDVREKPFSVIGVGVDIPERIDADAFKKKYSLDEYMIYVGRIDEGKDCPRMLQYFIEYKKRNKNELKLVLMGKAVIPIPEHPDIVNLGFVPDEDKFNGIQGAKFLVLPSKYESLSISVLEAMAFSVPVLVNGICKVLKGHCEKSNAGLYYENYFEFEGAVNFLITRDPEYKEMRKNAKSYIDRNYQWDIVSKSFQNMIETNF